VMKEREQRIGESTFVRLVNRFCKERGVSWPEFIGRLEKNGHPYNAATFMQLAFRRGIDDINYFELVGAIAEVLGLSDEEQRRLLVAYTLNVDYAGEAS
jgi:hypothetical protein